MDIGYSYRLAKKMEEFKSNPVLGYRTAGSKAEFDTGEFLKAEMERIGLSDIHKDEICLDSWEFEKAVMRFTDRDGEKHEIQLGAYQTEFVTDGWKEYPLVYAGRGKEADYDGVDVTGCLVMVDINQRDEWWINYPVYQSPRWRRGRRRSPSAGYRRTEGRPSVFHVEKGCGDPESGIKGDTADHGTV